jgi:hypothetical protein
MVSMGFFMVLPGTSSGDMVLYANRAVAAMIIAQTLV